jgi:hypothetical protein
MMGRTFVAITIALTLCACELVADIQDLHLTSDASTSDVIAIDASGDALADAGADADAQPSDGATQDGFAIEMIDDMEANTGLVLAVKGRSGAWFTYNDGTTSASQSPDAGGKFLPSVITPPRGSSNYASRTNGLGFTVWGAGMGFNVNDPPSGPNQGKRSTYDAGGYDGFVFWARIGTGTTAAVRFNVPNKDTDPAGGVCSPPSACSDYFGKNLVLTDTWTMYIVKYSDLQQLGWGQPVTTGFDPKTIYGCQLAVGANTTFDVWIDDIAFLLP